MLLSDLLPQNVTGRTFRVKVASTSYLEVLAGLDWRCATLLKDLSLKRYSTKGCSPQLGSRIVTRRYAVSDSKIAPRSHEALCGGSN